MNTTTTNVDLKLIEMGADSDVRSYVINTLIAGLQSNIDELNSQLSTEYSIRRDLERRICELERELG